MAEILQLVANYIHITQMVVARALANQLLGNVMDKASCVFSPRFRRRTIEGNSYDGKKQMLHGAGMFTYMWDSYSSITVRI